MRRHRRTEIIVMHALTAEPLGTRVITSARTRPKLRVAAMKYRVFKEPVTNRLKQNVMIGKRSVMAIIVSISRVGRFADESEWRYANERGIAKPSRIISMSRRRVDNNP